MDPQLYQYPSAYDISQAGGYQQVGDFQQAGGYQQVGDFQQAGGYQQVGDMYAQQQMYAQYQQQTQYQHQTPDIVYSGYNGDYRRFIYEVPDMSMGSIEPTPRRAHLYDWNTKRISQKEITIPDAFEKLYKELLDNANDNVIRSVRRGVNPGSIEVTADRNYITVRNGGLAIPIDIDPSYNKYIPECIFGELMYGSNFAKQGQEREQVGGRNGHGAKLTNIYSHEFKITCCNGEQGKYFTQTWSNNMQTVSDRQVGDYMGISYTEVTYRADFERFKMSYNTDDVLNSLAAQVIDLAFNTGVRVTLTINMEQPQQLIIEPSAVRQERLIQHAQYYSADKLDKNNTFVHVEWPANVPMNTDTKYPFPIDPRVLPIAEMCLVDAVNAGGCVSFANGIPTRDGGAHVKIAWDAVSGHITEMVSDIVNGKKKKKDTKDKDEKPVKKVTLANIKPHVFMVLKVNTSNITFTSQSKFQSNAFKEKITVAVESLKHVAKWGLMHQLQMDLENKLFADHAMKKGRNREYDGIKGDPANKAGTSESQRCILVLVEGDSASGYPDSMKQAWGQDGEDYIGILPLKGKILNVLKATPKEIADNEQINEFCKMLNIRPGVQLTPEELREVLNYGKIMILTDADTDGAHIKGLILAMIAHLFPILLQMNMVCEWKTPIIRYVKNNQTTIKFFTEREHEKWLETKPDFKFYGKPFYFKGLGSSDKEDTFEDVRDPYQVACLVDNEGINYINMFFGKGKDKADTRKKWIMHHGGYIDSGEIREKVEPVSRFVHNDLSTYLLASLERAIPGPDGLKKVQRQVFWGILQKWGTSSGTHLIKKDADFIKVAQFAQFASGVTKYHHGAAIEDAIKYMTTEIPGTNNMPYFKGKGDFGSRRHGPKKMAAGRYSMCKPAWWLGYLVKTVDLNLIPKNKVEGEEVEPEYIPFIIPMHLINGISGIATAWSTFGADYHPMDICETLKKIIRGESFEEPIPFYKGFDGTIQMKRLKSKLRRVVVDDSSRDHIEEDDGYDIRDIEQQAAEIGEDAEEEEEEEEENTRPTTMCTKGQFNVGSKGEVIITELPLGIWGKPFNIHLTKLKAAGKITKFQKIGNKDKPGFIVHGFKDPTYKSLGLVRNYGLTNFWMLNRKGVPTYFESVREVLYSFFTERYDIYELRKRSIINELQTKLNKLENKRKFLELVLQDQHRFVGREDEDVKQELDTLGIDFEAYAEAGFRGTSPAKYKKLVEEIEELRRELDRTTNKDIRELWIEEIEDFQREYCKQEKLDLPLSMRQGFVPDQYVGYAGQSSMRNQYSTQINTAAIDGVNNIMSTVFIDNNQGVPLSGTPEEIAAQAIEQMRNFQKGSIVVDPSLFAGSFSIGGQTTYPIQPVYTDQGAGVGYTDQSVGYTQAPGYDMTQYQQMYTGQQVQAGVAGYDASQYPTQAMYNQYPSQDMYNQYYGTTYDTTGYVSSQVNGYTQPTQSVYGYTTA